MPSRLRRAFAVLVVAVAQLALGPVTAGCAASRTAASADLPVHAAHAAHGHATGHAPTAPREPERAPAQAPSSHEHGEPGAANCPAMVACATPALAAGALPVAQRLAPGERLFAEPARLRSRDRAPDVPPPRAASA